MGKKCETFKTKHVIKILENFIVNKLSIATVDGIPKRNFGGPLQGKDDKPCPILANGMAEKILDKLHIYIFFLVEPIFCISLNKFLLASLPQSNKRFVKTFFLQGNKHENKIKLVANSKDNQEEQPKPGSFGTMVSWEYAKTSSLRFLRRMELKKEGNILMSWVVMKREI